jgi:hypothetical protein
MRRVRFSGVLRGQSKASAYIRPFDGLAPRSNRRSNRIATYRNSTTSAIATSGAASAKKDMRAAPPSSAVETTKFPSPPVKTVECALRTPVNPRVNPATPPPAITAAVHFTIGGMSVMTAADRMVPAMNAVGADTTSSRLSTNGMMSAGNRNQCFTLPTRHKRPFEAQWVFPVSLTQTGATSMLEIIAQPDNTFALIRRHRGIDGRMVDTVISRWPTRNSAYDALYDTLHAKLRLADHVTAGVIVATAAAIIIGACGLWYGSDIASATPSAPYAVTAR